MPADINLLKKLTEAGGVPGYEDDVREIIKDELRGRARISFDKLGSIICRKPGDPKGPKIMFCAHMDEVGFMVKHITREGCLKFTNLGGWWPQAMLAHRVKIITEKGIVDGVIGAKPPHILTPEERKKNVQIKDMFMDVGSRGLEETEKLGIKPGDPAFPYAEFTVMSNGDSMMAKAWDDRVGCALFIQLIRELDEKHPNVVYGVGSSQEEVHMRGARTSSQKIKPDVAFALEVGLAGDTPGVTEDESRQKIGMGPVVWLLDKSLIPNRRLREFVIDTAREIKIPCQVDCFEGAGQDAGAIQYAEQGVPAIALGVPARYVHSSYGILSREDYSNTLRLLKELVRRLDKRTAASFTSY